MAKSLVLGNGTTLACLDQYGQVKDLYYPYVGTENHIGRNATHKLGIWVDGLFSWLSDGSWHITIGYEKHTMVSRITAVHKGFGITLSFSDAVYNESNIFLRSIRITNERSEHRTLKLFFNQQFHIAESPYGNTAYIHPSRTATVHYKHDRYFVCSGTADGAYTLSQGVGLLGIEGKEGTWKDAEDGTLSGNGIEHGSVDSVWGIELSLPKKKARTVDYWITMGKNFDEAWGLHEDITKRSPSHLLETTRDYWHAWLTKREFVFQGLSDDIVDTFYRSLLVMRAHTDNNGGIIASGDSDILQYGRDTYGYVWPRDAAFTAFALEKAGYFHVAERFFEFCNKTLTTGGYLLHKYNPDTSVGTSWHPWVTKEGTQLPIQEDETAIVLCILWEHYLLTRDLEFIERIYNSFIKKTADFLVSHRDEKTGLPLPSYDLWEERRGVHAFTASVVYGALSAAASFAETLGKDLDHDTYARAAKTMKEAIISHFYNEAEGYVLRTLFWDSDGSITEDTTVDASSVYGIFRFGVLAPDDPRLARAYSHTHQVLSVHSPSRGVARYENDQYHRQTNTVPGNPWFITTLWYAEYLTAVAKNEKDLDRVKDLLSWAVSHASPSGMFAEQLDPETGAELSVSPLTWSHTLFVLVVVRYLEKLNELGICATCYPINPN